MSKASDLLKKYEWELTPSGKVCEGTIFEADYLPNTPITVQENLFRMLDGKKPAWHPKDIDYVLFTPRILPDNTARAYTFEKYELKPEEKGGKDMFGVEWEYVEVVGGSMVRPGEPKVPDITCWEDYITFPDIDSYDWAGNAEENKDFFPEGYPIYIQIMNGLFERLISFMGMEEAMIALIDDEQQEGVHRLFDKLAILYDQILEHYSRYYGANMLCFHDDWGSQRAPFFSLDVVQEMILPYLKRVFESAHKYGFYVDFHSCGKNELLVPAMIEAKADMWYPQPMNDYDYLYKTYGNDIIFGIPLEARDGSEEAAWDLAVEFMEKYGKNHNTMPFAAGETNLIFNKYLYCLSREEFAD